MMVPRPSWWSAARRLALLCGCRSVVLGYYLFLRPPDAVSRRHDLLDRVSPRAGNRPVGNGFGVTPGIHFLGAGARFRTLAPGYLSRTTANVDPVPVLVQQLSQHLSRDASGTWRHGSVASARPGGSWRSLGPRVRDVGRGSRERLLARGAAVRNSSAAAAMVFLSAEYDVHLCWLSVWRATSALARPTHLAASVSG